VRRWLLVVVVALAGCGDDGGEPALSGAECAELQVDFDAASAAAARKFAAGQAAEFEVERMDSIDDRMRDGDCYD